MAIAANCLIIHQFYHTNYPFGNRAGVFNGWYCRLTVIWVETRRGILKRVTETLA